MQTPFHSPQTDTTSSGFSHLSFNTENVSSSGSAILPAHSVSKAEATLYYAGISPTPPKLVYRTGSTTWPFVMPEGPEAYPLRKEARGVYNHKLNLVWGTVGPKVCDMLDASKLTWTTVDGVRFCNDATNESAPMLGPVVIWIGVRPGSLEAEQAFNMAEDILKILQEFDIDDVEVEFRESLYHRTVGPALLKPVPSDDNTVDVRGPLTTALGLSISAVDRPDSQGTLGIYFAENSDSTAKMFALTCHHVVLKVDATHNEDYTYKKDSGPRKEVQLLGTRAFNKLVDSIGEQIKSHQGTIADRGSWIARYEIQLEGDIGHDIAETTKRLQKARVRLEDATEAIEDLQNFLDIVKNNWGSPEQRIIGHICRSPPLLYGVQPDGFTQDWAVIELDKVKFCEFKGNFIDLGTEKDRGFITSKMCPRTGGTPSFKYPEGGLLPVRGMISEQLMRAPDMQDENGEPCLLVIKNGSRTGVTIGRATGIESFVRDEETNQRSKEWAVFSYGGDNRAFSRKGDSGSMVVDGLGRMGGILQGGAGITESSDASYIIPMCKLWPEVKAVFTDAQFYHQDSAY